MREETNNKEKRDNKLIVRKHSAVIQMSNKITAQQRKIFNFLLHFARKNVIRDIEQDIFVVPMADIKKLIGIRTSNNKQIKKNFKKLVDTQLEYNVLGKDNKEQWGIIALLAEAKFKDGIVKFGFAPSIRQALFTPRMYALLDLGILKNLKSKYSIALYELAKDYINREIPRMDIEKFRDLMGIKNTQYFNGTNLKLYVIDVAIDEINGKTDLNIEYVLGKRGNKFIDIKFYIKKKENYDVDIEKVEIVEEIIEMFKEKFGERIDSTLANDLVNEYGGERVLAHVRRIKSDKEKIPNPIGFLITSLREDYELPFTHEELDEEREKRESVMREKKEAEKKELAENIRKEEEKEDELTLFYEELGEEDQRKVINRKKEIIKEKYFKNTDSLSDQMAMFEAIENFRSGETFWDIGKN